MLQRQIIWPLTYWRTISSFYFHGDQRSLPISEESFENISSYSSHNFSKSILYLSRTSASCSLTFLCVSTSAGEVMNFFSDDMSQRGFSFSIPSLRQLLVAPISTRALQSVCSRVAGTVAPTVVPTVTNSTLEFELLSGSSVKNSCGSYPFVSQVWSAAKSIKGSFISRSLFSSNISQRSAASDSVSTKSKLEYAWESSFTSSIVSSI